MEPGLRSSSSMSSLHARIETLKARQRERQSGLAHSSSLLSLDTDWAPGSGRLAAAPLSASTTNSTTSIDTGFDASASEDRERARAAPGVQAALARASSLLHEARLARPAAASATAAPLAVSEGMLSSVDHGSGAGGGAGGGVLSGAGGATVAGEARYCESCVAGSTVATMYCRNCGGWLCGQCDTQLHPFSNALLRRHVRTPADQVRRPVMCSRHRSDEATYFCLDCEAACVCSECVIRYDHRGHNVEPLAKAVPAVRNRISSLASQLQSRMDQWNAMQRRQEAQRQVIQDSADTVKDSVRRAFAELQDALQRTQDELLARVDADAWKELDAVATSLDTIAEHVSSLTTTLEVLRGMASDQAGDPARFLNAYVERAAMLEQGADAIPSPRGQIAHANAAAPRRFTMDHASASEFLEALKGLKLVIESCAIE